MNAVRMQGLNRVPPQQPTMLVVKQERGPAASIKPGHKSCVGLSYCRHDGLVMVWDKATMINCVGVTNVPRQR